MVSSSRNRNHLTSLITARNVSMKGFFDGCSTLHQMIVHIKIFRQGLKVHELIKMTNLWMHAVPNVIDGGVGRMWKNCMMWWFCIRGGSG